MLNQSVLEALAERLVNRIEEVNTYTLEVLGSQIKRIGSLTPTNAYKLLNTLKYGGDLDNIINKLSYITNLNVKDIYDIFDEIAKKDLNFAKQFYDYKGVDFIPYEQNIALQQQVKALADITAKSYLNISSTTAFVTRDNLGKKIITDISQTYQNTIDKAIINLSQGRETYDSTMRAYMKELSSSGLKTVNYANGYSRRLDSSVRMNILDGMRDLSNTLQKQFGEEFGADGVEISVHENPAEDHKDIQGKQYSNAEFEALNNSLERSISTMNCYHYIFSIVMGVSKPQYSQEQLNEINSNNEKGFDFDGEHYSNYEGTQLQRQLETKIRQLKDNQIGAKAMGDRDMVDKYQKQIAILNKKYKELSNISGLPTKVQRLKVEGYKRV